MKRKYDALDEQSPEFRADVTLDTAAQLAIEVKKETSLPAITACILASLREAIPTIDLPEVRSEVEKMLEWPVTLPVTAITRIFSAQLPDDRAPCLRQWLSMLVTDESTRTSIQCSDNDEWNQAVCAAARAGEMTMFRRLRRYPNGLPVSTGDLFVSASSGGQISILKCLKESDSDSFVVWEHNATEALMEASKHGHIHVLQYLLGEDLGLHDEEIGFAVLRGASEGGQVRVLDWAKSIFSYDFARQMESCVKIAAQNNQCEVLEWIAASFRQSFQILKDGLYTLRFVAEKGSFATLDWLRINFPSYLPSIYVHAIWNDSLKDLHVDAIDWCCTRYPEIIADPRNRKKLKVMRSKCRKAMAWFDAHLSESE